MMDFRSLLLVILWNTAGSLDDRIGVTCSHQTICALQESEVEMTCSYSDVNIKTVFWISFKEKVKWRNEEHQEDLALDSDYAGRVSYTEPTNSSSTLTIRDLREKDSGEYQLMIITEKGEKYLSSPVFSLTVTDLQVKQTGPNMLTCSTSCTLPLVHLQYHWYKNGYYTEKYTENPNPFVLPSNEGSFSCSVTGYNSIMSSQLCVSGNNCWNVTYTDRRVCVLEGSSVVFPCTYSYPSDQTIKEVFWYYHQPVLKPEDLKVKVKFPGQVDYIEHEQKNCALKMKNVTKSNTGVYCFRFITQAKGFSGKPGVILNVTALQVRVSPSTRSDGQMVTLICSSTCTLSNNPTYIWYQNRQPVTNKLTIDNKLYLKCSEGSEDAGNYSCAVTGHEMLHSPDYILDCPGGTDENVLLSKKMTKIILVISVILALILMITALWKWRKKSRSVKNNRRSGQDDIHYSSIHFSHSASPRRPHDTAEEKCVQYAAVKFNKKTAANK